MAQAQLDINVHCVGLFEIEIKQLEIEPRSP